MVEMTVQRVGLCTKDGGPVVVLQDAFGERFLEIRVTSLHANALMRHNHRIPPFRPQTHEVLLAVIQALDGTITGASIDGVDQDGLIAQLKVSHGGRVVVVPTSAADAVVLAVRARAPISVEQSVVDTLVKPQADECEQASPTPSGEARPRTLVPEGDVFRRFIDSLSKLDELGRG